MKINKIILLLIFITTGIIQVSAKNINEAYFAGGCFWCMEPPFEQLDGVSTVISGFSGGKEINPQYHDVASGITGHRETIKIVYDANIVSYQTLLNVFWRQIDPTDNTGQFVDRGFQYSSAIFYVDEEQKKLAENSKIKLQKSGWFNKPIITQIEKFSSFYPAEDYHQDYYKTRTLRYKYYRNGSGRDAFLKKVWAEEVDDIDEIPPKN